jgi:hypothetical protein
MWAVNLKRSNHLGDLVVDGIIFIWVLDKPSMTIAAFWVVAPCSLVDIDRRFRDAYYLHHQGDSW